MASTLFSRGVHEKMSILTVPVSGQVCSTACDSRRTNTQVSPSRGKACDTMLTIVPPACRTASMKSAATSSPSTADNAQPERSAENDAGAMDAGMPALYPTVSDRPVQYETAEDRAGP